MKKVGRRSGYLKAQDVFKQSYIAAMRKAGLDIIDPDENGASIFKFDSKGRPISMIVRAMTKEAYLKFAKSPMYLSDDGVYLNFPIPVPGGADPEQMRPFLQEKYRYGESGSQGSIGTEVEEGVEEGVEEKVYGSGWPEEASSIPDMGSSGPRGPQSGGDAQKSPAMPPQEDAVLDENLSDKGSWPSHLDVEVKKREARLSSLGRWLEKKGLYEDSRRVFNLISKS